MTGRHLINALALVVCLVMWTLLMWAAWPQASAQTAPQFRGYLNACLTEGSERACLRFQTMNLFADEAACRAELEQSAAHIRSVVRQQMPAAVLVTTARCEREQPPTQPLRDRGPEIDA